MQIARNCEKEKEKEHWKSIAREYLKHIVALPEPPKTILTETTLSNESQRDEVTHLAEVHPNSKVAQTNLLFYLYYQAENLKDNRIAQPIWEAVISTGSTLQDATDGTLHIETQSKAFALAAIAYINLKQLPKAAQLLKDGLSINPECNMCTVAILMFNTQLLIHQQSSVDAIIEQAYDAITLLSDSDAETRLQRFITQIRNNPSYPIKLQTALKTVAPVFSATRSAKLKVVN